MDTKFKKSFIIQESESQVLFLEINIDIGIIFTSNMPPNKGVSIDLLMRFASLELVL